MGKAGGAGKFSLDEVGAGHEIRGGGRSKGRSSANLNLESQGGGVIERKGAALLEGGAPNH